MDSKTKEIQEMLIVLAERMGVLQLKLKQAEGEEYERLMGISKQVRALLEELVDTDNFLDYEVKAQEAFAVSQVIVK